MSQENVDLVRRVYDAFNEHDLDALLALMDEAVEAVPRMVEIEGGYRGHEGIRRWWEELFDVFPDLTIEVGDVRDAGELVVAALRFRGHGAGSGTLIDEPIWHVTRWPSDKCAWWRTFSTRSEALEAAGLHE